MALDMKPIYGFLGLNNDENLTLNISLKRDNNIFYGKKEVFNSNPVLSKINFKGGQFTIAAIPKMGWADSINEELKLSRLVICVLIIFLAIIIYLLTYKDQKIRALVKHRTGKLKEINDILKEKEKVIRNKAYNDYLTGLYNRRYFENEIKRLDSSRKYPIAIVIGDLDGLKVVNDNFGHKKGDEYLINAADILKSTARTEDIVARIGGDEFAIILPTTNQNEAKRFCQRIKNNFEDFNKKKEPVLPLLISLGFEVMGNKRQNLNEIFNKADQKMYINKGRK